MQTPAKTVLLIGNKNYSSWSLRPWLAMKEETESVPQFEMYG